MLVNGILNPKSVTNTYVLSPYLNDAPKSGELIMAGVSGKARISLAEP